MCIVIWGFVFGFGLGLIIICVIRRSPINPTGSQSVVTINFGRQIEAEMSHALDRIMHADWHILRHT